MPIDAVSHLDLAYSRFEPVILQELCELCHSPPNSCVTVENVDSLLEDNFAGGQDRRVQSNVPLRVDARTIGPDTSGESRSGYAQASGAVLGLDDAAGAKGIVVNSRPDLRWELVQERA